MVARHILAGIIYAYLIDSSLCQSIEILEPKNGDLMPSANRLNMHIRISGVNVGLDAMADLYFDGNHVGSLPDNEVQYQIDGGNTLGVHRISVVLTDISDQPLGIEAHSIFQVILDPEKARSTDEEGSLDCMSTIDKCSAFKEGNKDSEGTSADFAANR